MRTIRRWVFWILVLQAAVLLVIVRGDLRKPWKQETEHPRLERFPHNPVYFEDEMRLYLRPDLKHKGSEQRT